MCKVSVIVPVYGVEKFITHCADSLMAQTMHEGVEYIFVDDASQDASMERLKSVLSKYPARANQVKILVHERNMGLPAARNTGLTQARGEYVFHCDSDDFGEPEMLETLYGKAKEEDADIVWCDWFLTFGSTERYMAQPECGSPEEALKAMLGGAMKFNVWNKLVRKSLYTDNAVGCSCNGFEAWAHPNLYLRASAGAPPDILSQNGQNWGVLGFNPLQLRAQGYEPYRRSLEANMKYAGCTRIDHVLQLQRLYMIPLGKKEKEGAFIHYNTDELMAIVALESHRNKTMVIGEDLGLIPDGFRPKLEDFGILSYRVLPFERDWGYKTGYGTNAMRHPHEYPQNSVCATSTHDTLPLVGQWNVQDIFMQEKFGLITKQQANDKFEQYATQREALNYALEEKGCWARVGGSVQSHPREDSAKIPYKYEQAVMDYLGQSNSAIMLVPFSDIFGTKEMGNIPGMQEMPMHKQDVLMHMKDSKAYPCWRRKMFVPVEHIDKAPIFKEISSIINRYRPDGNDGRGHYFEFRRMGEQKESVIDFERYHRLYDKINTQNQFEQRNILEHRYAQKRREFMERKAAMLKNTFQTKTDNYNAYRMLQRQKIAQEH